MAGPLPGLGGPLGSDDQLWHGERPRQAPAGTLRGPTGRTVDYPVHVLTPENFDRAAPIFTIIRFIELHTCIL